MNIKNLMVITSTSLLFSALAGCASHTESDSDMTMSSSSSSVSSMSSSSMSMSSSSAYSLSSSEMLNKQNQTVYFDFDSAALDNEAESTLMKLPKLENYNTQDVTVTLTGHADAVGPESYNKSLSRKRAEAVRDAIKDNFPASTAFEIIAEGETDPKSSNDSEYGRSKNRRVEITYSAE